MATEGKSRKQKLVYICLIFTGLSGVNKAQQSFQKMQGVNYADVKIEDPFWSPKINDVATQALHVCIYQTEEATPRISNFEKAAARSGRHEGIYYDDSDVYKALEAIAYTLHTVPDTKLEAKADDWIDKIAAAQLEDGYLNTYYTLEGLENRWSDMERHEAYCAGHLIEAAIAYYHATGKRKLLDVAIKFADHMDQILRQANKPWVAGHQEIELALVKLYRTTSNEKYLKLAEWFLEQRGRGHGKGKIWDDWKDPGYAQDALPVKEQYEITGHAVRAMYMYTGVADVAAVTEDEAYLQTMLKVWEDVVHRNTYVTGGIGAAGHNEGFDKDYVLPNEHAYCETCASVGMVFWNQRMNRLTGEGKYIDVLERSLYNSALDGISLDGKQFFYPNPLASSGQHRRRDWFGTACCPSNISRLITSIGNYIYGKSRDGLWVNLFISSETKQEINGQNFSFRLETKYPWDTQILLTIDPEKSTSAKIRIRIPGWVIGEALPGDLYTFVDAAPENISILINGEPADYQIQSGYAVLDRTWQPDTKVEIILPMQIRKVRSRPEVSENKDRLALQYGPMMYCFEAADNDGDVFNILLSETDNFEVMEGMVTDEPVMKLSGKAKVARPSANSLGIELIRQEVIAIPYYTWCNRGSNEMQVWMPEKIQKVRIE